jgi:hypothetical protein
LEDERDQIISVLSGTPGTGTFVTGDRAAMRARLEELNKEIKGATQPRGSDNTIGEGAEC